MVLTFCPQLPMLWDTISVALSLLLPRFIGRHSIPGHYWFSNSIHLLTSLDSDFSSWVFLRYFYTIGMLVPWFLGDTFSAKPQAQTKSSPENPFRVLSSCSEFSEHYSFCGFFSHHFLLPKIHQNLSFSFTKMMQLLCWRLLDEDWQNCLLGFGLKHLQLVSVPET